MKNLAIILLLSLLVGCQQNSIKQFTEVSTETRQLSSLYISLDPSGGMPSSIIFYSFGTLVEDSTRRISDGAPSGLAVKLSQEELVRIRVIINEIHRFTKIESFQSVRSPATAVKAPNLPNVGTMLAREERPALQIRSSSIYREAYYICEFGTISENQSAQDLLRKLRTDTNNKEVVEAIDRLLTRN